MRGPTLVRSRLRPGPRLRLHHPRVERLLDAFGDVAQIRVARFAPCAAGVEVDLETVALRPGWVLFPDQTAFLSKSGGRPITKIDVYTYIDARDLALAFRRAVEIPHKGHEALFIVADDSCANEPLSEGLPRVAPELKDMARVIEGDRSGINNSRAKKVLGWDPKHTWRRPDW